jgi:hypothetical protein
MKCTTCNNQYTPACDYKQGRCPHHPALIDQILSDPYKARYYNLIQTIKNFLRGIKK